MPKNAQPHHSEAAHGFLDCEYGDAFGENPQMLPDSALKAAQDHPRFENPDHGELPQPYPPQSCCA
jgi:hypothetical protein